MKLKNLFYLLLAMPLAFAACNETPDVPPTPDPEPSFTLTSDATMEFEAQGGEGTITFVYDFTDKETAVVNILLHLSRGFLEGLFVFKIQCVV
jgi:hypothetical protein